MKVALQHNYNSEGDPQSVTISMREWRRIVRKIRKSDQILKISTDLKEALQEVKDVEAGKATMQTWKSFRESL